MILNWEPIYKGLNGLEKGIHETINWIKDNSNKGYFIQKYIK